MANTQMEVRQSAPAPASDPWQSLRNEMDRVFDRFAGGFGMPSLRRMFEPAPGQRADAATGLHAPAVDITEDETAYKLTAELPGLEEKDVEVVVSGDVLTVKGEKKQESEQKDKNFYLSERSYGAFQRRFYIPDGVDRDGIEAGFAKGVLTVTMPKAAGSVKEPKKIDVKAS